MRQRAFSCAVHGSGFDICGIDLSAHMLERLKKKAPSAKAVQADILEYDSPDWFDYIFYLLGSISFYRYEAVQKDP